MRGAVSGGMALALDELGLARAFDAAYGSSAGTLNAMWLVSGRVSTEGIITPIVPFADAAEAYRAIDEHPEDSIKLGIRF